MTEMRSIRVAYGKALVAWAESDPRIVVLDADVSKSTQSSFFGQAFPERFFNVGIAEPGMVDIGVGLALCGKIPVVNSFAFLLSLRCAEQIRTHLGYGHANVKLAAAYGGLSDSFDGPTHQAISDLATMRAIPGITVVVPADAVETAKLLPKVLEWNGPVYLRLSRAEMPVIFEETYAPEIGQGVVLRDGSDVTIVNCGVLLGRCLEAADCLATRRIQARVINLHTLKPLDTAILVRAAQETGALVTVEEHVVNGGLGGAVAEVMGKFAPVPIETVGLHETFAETGPYASLLDRYGMAVSDIAAAAERVVARRFE